MKLNSAFIRLIPIVLFVLLFPFVQKQWLNLSLLNPNNYTFYSILYCLSGITCPLLVSYYSLRDFTYYKFNNVININNQIKGKTLLITVILILIPLSFLSLNYLYINLDLVFKYLFDSNYFQKITFIQNLYFTSVVCILFVYRNTKILIKKLTLFNFILVSSIMWYSSVNSFFFRDELLVNSLLNNNYSSILNIIFLFTFEILYYFWSYISNNNNLSNWLVPVPTQNYIVHISKVLVFFLFIIVYYSILE